MKNFLFASIFASIFATISVSAQAIDPVGWYINNTMISTRVFNSAMANQMLNKAGKSKNSIKTNAPNQKAPVNYTAFKSNSTNSISSKLATSFAKDAQTQEQAKRLFDSFLETYRQTARKDGFPADDLAYAFEYFVVNNYSLYHDLLDVPYEKDPRVKGAKDMYERLAAMNKKNSEKVRPEQERLVYSQFKQHLSENPAVQKMTDAQKQEVTELFAIMTGFNFMSYLKGINDQNEDLTQKARNAAQQGLEKLLGAPIGEIRINYKGLDIP